MNAHNNTGNNDNTTNSTTTTTKTNAVTIIIKLFIFKQKILILPMTVTKFLSIVQCTCMGCGVNNRSICSI